MKYFYCLPLLLLYSCWQSEQAVEIVRPVKLTTIEPLGQYQREYLGVVSAAQESPLAFRVSGLVSEVYVTDGSTIKKGQLLCQLDGDDLRLKLSSARSNYLTTKSILERSERLLEREAISVQDYEIAKANYTQAKSAYGFAENQLSYTRLYAPFSGSVLAKYVDQFQRVSAGETVLKIIKPENLEVKFTLPQNELSLPVIGQFFVEFEHLPNREFSASVAQVVEASVGGAGIPVSLTITDPEFDAFKDGVRAGFPSRVKVVVDAQEYVDLFSVPLSAVFRTDELSQSDSIWIYDPSNEVVRSRAITIKDIFDTSSYIIEGDLKEGEKVVSSGVHQITDGQRVKVLEQ